MERSAKKYRVFLDTNILLSGSAFPRWPYEILQHALRGDFQQVISPTVIAEARRHFTERFSTYLDRFERFLADVDYELAADPTQEEIQARRDLNRDFSDVPIALAAMNAKVDYLVSEDKDLTVQDDTTEELRQHVEVRLSGTFLREVMGWTSEQLEAIRHRKWDDFAEEK
jgi:putative PIN family toxin of toxin-antitoxin system